MTTLPLAAAEYTMRFTVGGWIAMILSVGFVTGLLAWCLRKVVATPQSTRHIHSQSDIETPDAKEQ